MSDLIKTLDAKTKGEVVAGEYIAKVDGKAQVLGRFKDGAFSLNETGLLVLDGVFQAPANDEAPKAPKARKTRGAIDPAPEPEAGTEAETDQQGELFANPLVGTSHELTLDDAAALEDAAG